MALIDELFVYGRKDSVFKSIVAQITSITRYHVSPNYGYDLNTTNLQLFIKDKSYGLMDISQKYPICVCITPQSTPTYINNYMWERFFFSLFFLERTGYLADNTVRDLDEETQISQDEPADNWSRMKLAAMNFLDLLRLTLKGEVTTQDGTFPFAVVLVLENDRVRIRRLTNFNKDGLSGVQLDFTALFSIAACEVVVGDITYVVNTMLPEEDPVWEAEKGGYYTKDEVNELLLDIHDIHADWDIEEW